LGEFDASKIGTGEGAQAYGNGIYTAEAQGVGRGYQKALSNRPDASRNLYYDGKEVGQLAKSWQEQDVNDFAIRALQDVSSGMGSDQKAMAVAQQVRKVFPDAPLAWEDQVTEAARLIDANKGQILKGNLYKADLPDEKIAKMLDWDKPLNQQPKQIQESIRILTNQAKEDAANPNAMYGMATWSDRTSKRISPEMIDSMDGAAIHEMLQKVYGNDLSNKLNELGIPGIKYFDESSREVGKGTRNFVVFPGEEKSMRILERNGETAASPFYQDPFMDTTR
jgi:hypothetical protein